MQKNERQDEYKEYCTYTTQDVAELRRVRGGGGDGDGGGTSTRQSRKRLIYVTGRREGMVVSARNCIKTSNCNVNGDIHWRRGVEIGSRAGEGEGGWE